MKNLLLFIGTCSLIFVCSAVYGDNSVPDTLPQISEQNSSAVTVKEIDRSTMYTISAGDCKIEWIIRHSERGVIKHRTLCKDPISVQLPLLMQICTEFFGRDKNSGDFRTLFMGSLAPDGKKPGSQEMSIRLALAAHRSTGWDMKRGRAKNGNINGFVKDLANREMIYPELKTLFEHFNRNISFSCAEKVLVSEAGNLPFYDQLKQQGVKAKDKLPFDCMTWFSVSAK